MRNGQIIKILIDTGSNKNYMKPNIVPNPKQNETFFANSIGGTVKITHHTIVSLFNNNSEIKFFLLPTLKSFDAILGNDSLKQLNAAIFVKQKYMLIDNKTKIRIKEWITKDIKNIVVRDTHMSAEEKTGIKEILNKFPELFANPNKKLTYTTTVNAEIRTNTDRPIYSRTYPYPAALKNEVNKEIDSLLKDDIIKPSRSPYNAPVWIVQKKLDASGERKYRMVIDYRKLNEITIPDRYPMPETAEILARIGKKKYHTVLDLKSGFHQIPLREEDRQKTAFAVNNGKFEFTRLPFGLKNAPAIFQRCLDDILREHIGVRCYVYIDDIVISSDDLKTHLEDIEKIFITLEKANMKVQMDKCEFLKREVEFLGFIISENGIKTNPEKVKAINNFPQPTNIKELRSFLGMSGYYRKFIRDYAKIAKPITKYLRGQEGRTSKNESKKIAVR